MGVDGSKFKAVNSWDRTGYLEKTPPTEWKLLLVDFWATCCAPCREEFPHLNDLHARFASQGLVVIGLTQESKGVAQSFLPKVKIECSVGYRRGSKPLQKLHGIEALPYAVLVNKESKIVWRAKQAVYLQPKSSAGQSVRPNPSVEARPHGRPPGPDRWYADIFTGPGLASCRWARLNSNDKPPR